MVDRPANNITFGYYICDHTWGCLYFVITNLNFHYYALPDRAKTTLIFEPPIKDIQHNFTENVIIDMTLSFMPFDVI